MSRSQFYQTKAWKQVRRNIWLKQYCLCNRCHKPVYVDGISEYIPEERRTKGIVHHIEYLSDDNYLDDSIALNDNSHITFIIGGTLGVTANLRNKSNELICFSKMTFPHQLIRVFLLEQIFRAFKISNNETYHR